MGDVRLASVHPCGTTAHHRDLPADTKVEELSSSKLIRFISASHIGFCKIFAFVSDHSLFASEGRKVINLLVLINTGTPVIASGLETLLPLGDEPFMKY